MRILQLLAVLLFVSVGALSFGRARYPWAKWARWGAVAVFYFDQDGDVQTFTERVTEYLSVTPLHNATGTPAMNVRLRWTADGLPVGVHFAGGCGEKATLLALAAELETAQPWFGRVPAL